MAVILFSGRHGHAIQSLFMKPFCSAFGHIVIRIVTKQSYHGAIGSIRALIPCSVEAIFFNIKLQSFHTHFSLKLHLEIAEFIACTYCLCSGEFKTGKIAIRMNIILAK